MRTSPRNTRQYSYRGGQGMFAPQQQPLLQQGQGRRNTNITPLGGRGGINAPIHNDRHRTIRLVCPCSNMVVCTRLDRVIPTYAKAQSGAAVCEEFLNSQACPFLETCPRVHVLKEHTWNYITPNVNRDTSLFEPGFIVNCYGPRMDQYYLIRSEYVLSTRGSLEYVKMYNEHGDNFKGKFKLCENMLTQGKCNMGESCDDIHAVRNDVWNMESNPTHIAEPAALMQYPRLSAGVIVRAFEQNSRDSFVDYPGDRVLVTLGSRQYLTAFESEGTIPKKKMQHCAHFRTNRLCRRGENCRFLHIVTGSNGSLGNSFAGDVSPNSITPADSPNSDLTVNPRVRQSGAGISAGHVAGVVGQRFASGGSDAALLNISQGIAGEALGGGPGGFGPREDTQTKSEVASSGAASRGGGPGQTMTEASDKMRMISPTRRNNPYAMNLGTK